MSTTIEQLKLELQDLKRELLSLKQKEINTLKTEYDKTYSSLRQAIINTDDVQDSIQSTYEKLGLTNLFRNLMDINNPYSDELGFKFSQIIESKVNEILIQGLEGESNADKKDRFLRIVKKVINNPITDIVLNSNPIGVVVGNIVNVASNFIDSKLEGIERTGLGGAIKKIAITTNDEISNDKIKLFKNSIKKYSELYSNMLLTSRKLETRSYVIATTFESTYLGAKSLKNKYFGVLGINEGDIFNGLDSLFDKVNSPKDDFDYQHILDKQEVKDGMLFITNLPNLKAEANKYSNEFAKMLKEFLENYIYILETPIRDNWASSEIDRDKLDKIISRLISFKTSNIKESNILITSNFDETLLVVHFSDDLKKYVA